jgi:two-component system OmpR family response regulator
VPLTSQPLRILLVAREDDQGQLIRSALAASTTPRFLVEHAANGWEAQRQAAGGTYAALVLDYSLTDIDGETLLARLKAIGVGAPALLLTSTGWDEVVAGGDEYLPRTEGLTGARSPEPSAPWSSATI